MQRAQNERARENEGKTKKIRRKSFAHHLAVSYCATRLLTVNERERHSTKFIWNCNSHMFNRKENIKRSIYISAIHVSSSSSYPIVAFEFFKEPEKRKKPTLFIDGNMHRHASMYAISASANTGRTAKMLSSFNLMFTSFCHHQFHFVHSNASLFFHRSSISLWASEWIYVLWLASSLDLLSFFFSIHLCFRSTIFLHHIIIAIRCWVLFTFSDKCVNCTSQHFVLRAVGSVLFLHPYDSLLNEYNSQTENYCAEHIQSENCESEFVCVCCVHPKCYQLQPHFMNGFLSLCCCWFVPFFHDRKFLCFRNFILYLCVHRHALKLLFT